MEVQAAQHRRASPQRRACVSCEGIKQIVLRGALPNRLCPLTVDTGKLECYRLLQNLRRAGHPQPMAPGIETCEVGGR